MHKLKLLKQPHRGVLKITGPQAREFLQGMITNDVNQCTLDHAIYSAFLTANGKFLYDFFMIQSGDSLLIDAEKSILDEFQATLLKYRMRSKLDIENITSQMDVALLYGEGTPPTIENGIIYTDPRLKQLGHRAILPTNTSLDVPPGDETEFNLHRMKLGVPSPADMIMDKSIILEDGLDELGAIDWKKGCYRGQELIARTRYRGLVRKRLLPVEITGAAPDFDTDIMAGDQKAGKMRTHQNNWGLALLRLEFLDQKLTVGDTILTPRKPDWIKLESAA